MDYTSENCPFCFLDKKIEVIAENNLAFAIYDIFPVTKGHTLIITKRHCPNFFDTTSDEKIAIFSLIEKLKQQLEEKYQPEGFNIGVNINEAGGQTVPHTHNTLSLVILETQRILEVELEM